MVRLLVQINAKQLTFLSSYQQLAFNYRFPSYYGFGVLDLGGAIDIGLSYPLLLILITTTGRSADNHFWTFGQFSVCSLRRSLTKWKM